MAVAVAARVIMAVAMHVVEMAVPVAAAVVVAAVAVTMPEVMAESWVAVVVLAMTMPQTVMAEMVVILAAAAVPMGHGKEVTGALPAVLAGVTRRARPVLVAETGVRRATPAPAALGMAGMCLCAMAGL